MIVLAPELAVTGAELRQDRLPMPSPRVREAQRDGRARRRTRPKSLLPQQCRKQGLTPKLSRDAAGREAHGKLYLPCGLRPDAASA